MGLFEKLFGKKPKPEGEFQGVFKMLNGYTPRFTTYNGNIYEQELVRAAIHARATHISKLKVETTGSAKRSLQTKLKHAPNEFQTWSQFLYRLSTMLDIHNTAFIVPIWDEYGEPSGVFAPLPSRCEMVQYGGKPYLRYEFSNGSKAAVEAEWCGILTKHQYKSDFFGETNSALTPTMELMHITNEGIAEGVKSSATYRFMARMDNFTKPGDLAKERQRFTSENLSQEANGGGLLLFPNTYSDIRQIEAKPWIIDADQMQIIQDNVNRYFGVNEEILENKAFGDAWSAFYEGCVEAFAIQFSEVMTKMLFTFREQTEGNKVIATANRLQYMSNADKLQVSAQMLDRGIMSINDVRDIWNLPPVEGGDSRIIRGEYYNAADKMGDENEEDDNGQAE